MLLYAQGDENASLSNEELREGMHSALNKLERKSKVLAVPPDYTRYHSRGGLLTGYALEHYGEALTDILPALGTHEPMSRQQLQNMFSDVPLQLFKEHNWRDDVVTLGEVPADFVREASGGRVNYSWPAQVNRLLLDGEYDLILSIGQVVPHEVIGMANYNKNIFVGTGGSGGINKSHFLGAAYGMERIMGRADNPVRRVLNYAEEAFVQELPILYVQTVVASDENGEMHTRGLFIGDDAECFYKAAELSFKVNFKMLDQPLEKVVVHLGEDEYKSTWLGNKSIYRTRMAMADGGELVVLAPGLCRFGEDDQIDRLIRKYGYIGTEGVLEAVETNSDIQDNLSAAAHLIHGSSEGRFTITYCPGHVTREEIEGVNFQYADLSEMLARYDPSKLSDGCNTLPDGERIYFISNPAVGLWASKERFEAD